MGPLALIARRRAAVVLAIAAIATAIVAFPGIGPFRDTTAGLWERFGYPALAALATSRAVCVIAIGELAGRRALPTPPRRAGFALEVAGGGAAILAIVAVIAFADADSSAIAHWTIGMTALGGGGALIGLGLARPVAPWLFALACTALAFGMLLMAPYQRATDLERDAGIAIGLALLAVGVAVQFGTSRLVAAAGLACAAAVIDIGFHRALPGDIAVLVGRLAAAYAGLAGGRLVARAPAHQVADVFA